MVGQHGLVTEPKNPVDLALDLFVYAPLGFALDARTLLPKLIDRGRDQVNGQVTMARFMGRFAVQQGQSEAGKRLSHMQEQAASALVDLGILPRDELRRTEAAPTRVTPAPAAAPATATSTATSRATSTATSTTAAAPTAKRRGKKAARTPNGADAPTGATSAALAIPDYDSLAASQVIPRLEGLSGTELEAVRTYEGTKRGRKTILNKIAQLQG